MANTLLRAKKSGLVKSPRSKEPIMYKPRLSRVSIHKNSTKFCWPCQWQQLASNKKWYIWSCLLLWMTTLYKIWWMTSQFINHRAKSRTCAKIDRNTKSFIQTSIHNYNNLVYDSLYLYAMLSIFQYSFCIYQPLFSSV